MTLLGTVRRQLRSHPSLIPLFVFIGGGCAMAVGYLGRVVMYSPDVIFNRKNHPEPWNEIAPTYQYKFYSAGMDYSKLKKERPDY